MPGREILYWEAKRRLKLLRRFRGDVVEYFMRAAWDRRDNEWHGDDQAGAIRQRLNEAVHDVTVACNFVGVSPIIHYEPPPATGGFAGDVDIIANLFNLPRLRLPHQGVLDQVDRAIGIYRAWVPRLWRSLFNPLYWVGVAIAWAADLPFRVLRRAGFNAAQAEASLLGKIIKAGIQLVGAIGALLAGVGTLVTVLEKLDLLTAVTAVLHRLINP